MSLLSILYYLLDFIPEGVALAVQVNLHHGGFNHGYHRLISGN